MTRKDFEEIADILSLIKNEREKQKIVKHFVKYLEKKNDNFDAEKFRQACLN